MAASGCGDCAAQRVEARFQCPSGHCGLARLDLGDRGRASIHADARGRLTRGGAQRLSGFDAEFGAEQLLASGSLAFGSFGVASQAQATNE